MEADVPKTGARDEQSLIPVDTLGGQHVINGAVAIFPTSANRCSPSNGPYRDGELFTIYLCYHWRSLTQFQSCGCKVFGHINVGGWGWGVEGSRLEAWMKNHKSEVAVT